MNDGSLRYIPILEPNQGREPGTLGNRPFSIPKTTSFIIFCIFIVLFISYVVFLRPPKNFPDNTFFSIPRGETLSGITASLDAKNIIRSEFFFKSFFVLFGGTKGLKAGDYYLKNPQNSVVLAWRMTHAKYNLQNIKVTIPEGWNSLEIARGISQDERFTSFDKKVFIDIAKPYEGYLFPDTYIFLPNVTAQDVLYVMTENYKQKIESVYQEIVSFGKPITDVVNMASIIEKEARTEESRRIIAGILWKRIKEGMPLQVDATFSFVNGKKASSDLTLDDLKIDSPYNTYVYKGLPPGPISNPGLDTILATIRPIQTDYYFYLSDKKGDMHYAVTHDRHVENKFTYLK